MIYGIVGAGFGDMWASLHWCLTRHEGADPIQVSTQVGTGPYTDEQERLIEMLELIDTTRLVHLTKAPATHPIGYNCWTTKYLPTKQRWSAEQAIKGLIGYQFDGRSSAEVKNPPLSDVDLFHEWIRAGALNTVRIGRPLPLVDCVRLLCLSELFVGSCSGMSTLAISVGAPVFVVSYAFSPAYWYGPNPHTLCADLPGFMREYDAVPGDASDTLWGTWRLSGGAKISIKRGGGARWFDSTHSVPGIWRGEPPIISWDNGFRYALSLTAPNRMRITQHAPDGTTSCCFAARES